MPPKARRNQKSKPKPAASGDLEHGLGLEHEMAVVVRTPDGATVEVPPGGIARLSLAQRDGNSDPRDHRERFVQIPLPCPVSWPKMPGPAPPDEAQSILMEGMSRMYQAGVVTDLGTAEIYQEISAPPLPKPASSKKAKSAQAETFAKKNKRLAVSAARTIAAQARGAGVTHARGVLSWWGFAYFSVAWYAFTEAQMSSGTSPSSVVRIDDAKEVAGLLASATKRLYVLPPRPESQRQRRSSRRPSGIDVDSGFIEVRSDTFARATVASVAGEVKAREAEALKLGAKVAKAAGLSGPVSVLGTGGTVSRLQDHGAPGEGPDAPRRLRHTYGGSFHVWLTLPHKSGPSFDHLAFVADHGRAVRAIQWLEPLLVACMPGDPRAPGSGQEYPRSSMRARMNGLMGFGTASVRMPSKRPVICYESLQALNCGARPTVVHTDAVWLETKSGAHINILACQSQGRWVRAYEANTSSPLDGASFSISRNGTDVRFDLCAQSSLAERSGEPTCAEFIRSTRGGAAFYKGKGGRIMVATSDPDPPSSSGRSGSRQTRHFSNNRCVFEPRGIEVRLFDQMPGRCEETLLNLVVIAAIAGYATPSSLTGADAERLRPSSDSEWLLAMHDCSLYGSRVLVTAEYMKRAAAALGLKPPQKTGAEPLTAYAALNHLLQAAHERYGTHKYAQAFGYSGPAQFPDVNFPSWLRALRERMALDSSLSRSVHSVVSTARTSPDTLGMAASMYLGAGWEPDVFMLAELVRTNAL